MTDQGSSKGQRSSPSPSDVLGSIPFALRGYERTAVDSLFKKFESVHRDVCRQRDELAEKAKSAEGLKSDLAAAAKSEQALQEKLVRVDSELATYRKRDLLIAEMAGAAKRAAAEIRDEARDDATKVLKKTREHEAEILRSAEQHLRAAEQTAAETSQRETTVLAELAGRAEEAARSAAEMLKSADADVARLRADAQAEAQAIVDAAKDQESSILRSAEGELARRKAEREELRRVSTQLHDHLSNLVGALGRLDSTLDEEAEVGLGQNGAQEGLSFEAGEPAASPTSLTDTIQGARAVEDFGVRVS